MTHAYGHRNKASNYIAASLDLLSFLRKSNILNFEEHIIIHLFKPLDAIVDVSPIFHEKYKKKSISS